VVNLVNGQRLFRFGHTAGGFQWLTRRVVKRLT
jgi:hypothetical protein